MPLTQLSVAAELAGYVYCQGREAVAWEAVRIESEGNNDLLTA